MKATQLEAWVLSVYTAVRSHKQVEDFRVELKALWPDPQKAARRLAAHANAAGGEPILWIIGLDEERGVVQFDSSELANWRTQVEACFQGLGPAMQDLTVPTEDGLLIALLFDTSRAPFVVRNPEYGKASAGPVELEVPWREGTQVRSARRDDLLKILVPLEKLPFLEALSCYASVFHNKEVDPFAGSEIDKNPHLSWSVSVTLYVTPRGIDRVVFPVHRARLTMHIDSDDNEMEMERLSMRAPLRYVSRGVEPDSHTIASTHSEVIVDGPGRIEINGRFVEPVRELPITNKLHVKLNLTPAGGDRSVEQHLILEPTKEQKPEEHKWKWP